jgi:hypothetical protein
MTEPCPKPGLYDRAVDHVLPSESESVGMVLLPHPYVTMMSVAPLVSMADVEKVSLPFAFC